jgi:hypothetical protein
MTKLRGFAITFVWGLICLGGCGDDDPIELDAGTDAGSADAGESDAGSDAGVDAGADEDSGVDAGTDAGTEDAGPVECPALGGGYTFATEIPEACPAGTGENVYGTQITVDETTCRATIETTDAENNRLRIEADVMLRPDGSWGPSTIQLNGTDVECSASFSFGAPAQMAFDCGACDFTIRFGE